MTYDRTYWRSEHDERLIEAARDSGHELCIALGERLEDFDAIDDELIDVRRERDELDKRCDALRVEIDDLRAQIEDLLKLTEDLMKLTEGLHHGRPVAHPRRDHLRLVGGLTMHPVAILTENDILAEAARALAERDRLEKAVKDCDAALRVLCRQYGDAARVWGTGPQHLRQACIARGLLNG